MTGHDESTRHDQEAVTTVVAASAFILAFLGAVGFAIWFTVAGSTQWLGATLMVALGGLGIGLIAWARGLMPHGPHVEKRDMPGSSSQEEAATGEAFEAGAAGVSRRGLLGRLLMLGAGTTGLASLFPLRTLGPDPFPEAITTAWTAGDRLVTEDGSPLPVDELSTGAVATVFPRGRERTADTQVMLIRLDPARWRGTGPPPTEGYLAYSKVCTHAGCPVGLYQQETGELLCPCHQSLFDALDDAVPAFGPATRPLPRLPLDVDDEGFLIAADAFAQPIGPGFWTYPQYTDQDTGQDTDRAGEQNRGEST